jgi:hypothetical protein
MTVKAKPPAVKATKPRKSPERKPGARRPGRPRFEPTDEHRMHIQRLKIVDTPHEAIARILGIDDNTLVKYFDYELNSSKHDLLANVGATLYQKAIGGDTTACIFYLKTKGGWRETERKEITGANGEPLNPGALLPPLILIEYVDGDPGEAALSA